MHFEIPFILLWSCHPKHFKAGIIRKASVNYLEALRIIAVISGMGGNCLNTYSMEDNFIFYRSLHKTSCSLDTANSYGDLEAISGAIFSTVVMNYLIEMSSLSSLCSLLRESILLLIYNEFNKFHISYIRISKSLIKTPIYLHNLFCRLPCTNHAN